MSAKTKLSTALSLRRLRWRARRGLLENDLILEKFFTKHGVCLIDSEIDALHNLLTLDDDQLLKILLNQEMLPHTLATPSVQLLLHKLQAV